MTKKLTAAILALILIFAFTACTNGGNNKTAAADGVSVAPAPEDAVRNLEDILNGKYDGKTAALMLIPAGELDEVTEGNAHYYDELVEEVEKGAVKSLLDLREKYKTEPVTSITVNKIEQDEDKAKVTADISLTDGETVVWEKKGAEFSLRKVEGSWYIDYHTF